MIVSYVPLFRPAPLFRPVPLFRPTDFSVGCYCQHEDRCHRSILKQLLVENGAKVE